MAGVPQRRSDVATGRARQEARRQARHREILAAAAQVFHDRGLQGSLQEIADQVGVYKGSLYYHVASKEDLAFEVMADLLARAEREAEDAVRGEGPAVDRLQAWISSHVAFVARHCVQARVFVHDVDALPPRLRDELVAKRDSRRARLLVLLEESKREGALSSDVDVPVAALAILGMVNWVQEWYRPDGVWAPEALGVSLASIALHGLAVRARIGRLDDPPVASGTVPPLPTDQ